MCARTRGVSVCVCVCVCVLAKEEGLAGTGRMGQVFSRGRQTKVRLLRRAKSAADAEGSLIETAA